MKAGGGYALAVKIFSSDDGSELTPEITSIDPDELETRKAELVDAIADYDLLIADIDALALK